MPEPDPRVARLVELRKRLAEILSELQGLEPESQEQVVVLVKFAPVHAAVEALAKELES